MTIPDLQARVRRLDALSLGLMREVLYVERKQYILALRQTIGGLEDARVVLAGVVRRLEP